MIQGAKRLRTSAALRDPPSLMAKGITYFGLEEIVVVSNFHPDEAPHGVGPLDQVRELPVADVAPEVRRDDNVLGARVLVSHGLGVRGVGQYEAREGASQHSEGRRFGFDLLHEQEPRLRGSEGVCWSIPRTSTQGGRETEWRKLFTPEVSRLSKGRAGAFTEVGVGLDGLSKHELDFPAAHFHGA